MVLVDVIVGVGSKDWITVEVIVVVGVIFIKFVHDCVIAGVKEKV